MNDKKKLLFYLIGSIVIGVIVAVLNMFIYLDILTNLLIGAVGGMVLLVVMRNE